jgi:hypothetical protein
MDCFQFLTFENKVSILFKYRFLYGHIPYFFLGSEYYTNIGMARFSLVVQHLPSMYEALAQSLLPSPKTPKDKNQTFKKWLYHFTFTSTVHQTVLHLQHLALSDFKLKSSNYCSLLSYCYVNLHFCTDHFFHAINGHSFFSEMCAQSFCSFLIG